MNTRKTSHHFTQKEFICACVRGGGGWLGGCMHACVCVILKTTTRKSSADNIELGAVSIKWLTLNQMLMFKDSSHCKMSNSGPSIDV